MTRQRRDISLAGQQRYDRAWAVRRLYRPIALLPAQHRRSFRADRTPDHCPKDY